MSTSVELLVVGGTGRMGRTIVESAEPPCRIGGVVGVEDARPAWLPASILWSRSISGLLASLARPVVLSVSAPEGEAGRIAAAAAAGCPLVEGTTALGADALEALRRAAASVAVVHAPNFSAGVAVLRDLVRRVGGLRGPRWRPAILDRHHARKKDAPSGTALLLRDALGDGAKDAEVASFRHGGVVGEHSVYFVGEHEEIVLSHRAFDRRAFAAGALLAARFAAAAPPGLYGMEHVLGLGPAEDAPR